MLLLEHDYDHLWNDINNTFKFFFIERYEMATWVLATRFVERPVSRVILYHSTEDEHHALEHPESLPL